MISGPITSWQIDWETMEGDSEILFSCAPKSLWIMTTVMKLKDACSLEEIKGACSLSYDKTRQHIQKQRHHFANKDSFSQSYDAFFIPFTFIGWRLITYSIVVVFVIHWHESAMDLHVFPSRSPLPPPSPPDSSGSSQCTRPEHLSHASNLGWWSVFKLWCWRRLLRVPWTERSTNQSILKEINPEYSLEGLMLKLNLQYFNHIMQRASSSEKTLMLGKVESRKRRGSQRTRSLDGLTNLKDMSLSKPKNMVKDREAWHTAVCGVTNIPTRLSNWTTAIYKI